MSELEELSRRLPENIRRRYQLKEVLGSGASSEVFRAHQVNLDREVVLKLFHECHLDDPSLRARIHQEARILAEVKHPNVLGLLDHGLEEDVVYLTFPYQAGLPLDEVDQDQARRPAFARRLIGDLLAGLEHLHGKAIIHRDLKPSNILIGEDGSATIIDFGLARDLVRSSRITRTRAMIGTPLYMAPEQIEAEAADPRDDLYALGVIMYELVTGENPFAAVSLREVVTRHLRLVPPPLARVRPDLPGPLCEVVDLCLGKRREDRPASARAARRLLGRTGGWTARPEVLRESRVATRVLESGGRPRSAVLLRGRSSWRPLAALTCAFALGFSLNHLGGTPPPEPTESPAPVSVPATTPPSRSLPSSWPAPWEAGFAASVQAELDHLLEAGPSGPRGGSPRVAGYDSFPRDLMHDPAAWPALLSRLPQTARFRAWIVTGGRPRELEAGLLQELKGVDAGFHSVGLPRPFHPFLEAAPIAETIPTPRVIQKLAYGARWGPFPDRCTGWVATAALAVERGLEIERQKQAEGLSPDFDALPPVEGLVDPSPVTLVRFNAYTPQRRALVQAWLNDGMEQVQLALHACYRALGADEELGPQLVGLLRGAMVDLQVFFATSLATIPPEEVLGGPIRTTPERLLAAQFLVRARRGLTLLQQFPRGMRPMAIDLWRSILERPRERGEAGIRMQGKALIQLVSTLASERQYRRATALLQRYRVPLIQLDPVDRFQAVAELLAEVARDDELPLSEAELSLWRGRLRQHFERLSPEVQRLLRSEFQQLTSP